MQKLLRAIRAFAVPASVLALCLALSACAEVDHLGFATYTKVGLHVNLQDGTPTSGLFGYKRFQGTIIPVDVSTTDTAASVFAGAAITNSWMEGMAVYQVFATGTAAEEATKAYANGNDGNAEGGTK